MEDWDHFAQRGENKFDIPDLIKLSKDLPIEYVPMEEMEHLLDKKIWVTEGKDGRLESISPNDVTQGKVYDKDHRRRIVEAECKYPLLVVNLDDVKETISVMAYKSRMKNWGKRDPIDGMHRLAQLKHMGVKMVPIKVVSHQLLMKSKRPTK